MKSPYLSLLSVILISFLLHVLPLEADPLDLIGNSIEIASESGASIASSRGVSSISLNPSSLSLLKGEEFYTGYLLINPRVFVDYSSNGDEEMIDEVLHALEIGYGRGPLFGVQNLGAGLFLYFPLSSFVYQDSHLRHDEIYFISLEGAFETFRFDTAVSWGIGMVRAGVGTKISLDIEENEVISKGIEGTVIRGETEFPLSFTPYISLLLIPFDWLDLSIYFTGGDYVRTEGSGQIQIEGCDILDEFFLDSLSGYYPQKVILGISFRKWSLRLDTALSYLFWFYFRDSQTNYPQRRFENTVVSSLGLSWTILKGLDIRGGYSFIPNPYPGEFLEANFIDFQRHSFGSGLFFNIKKDFMGGGDLSGGVFIQYQYLVPLSVDKTPFEVYDDYPEELLHYSTGGRILSGGFGLWLRY